MTTLLVPGQRESVDLFAAGTRGGPAATAGAGPATTLLDSVKVVHAFSLTQVSRDRAERPIPIDTQDDDVMEIELEGGFTVWTSVARYREQLARYRPDAVTDAGVRFDVLPQPSVAERGVRDWVARALRLLRLEPDDISLEFASRGGERLAAWAATKLLLALIESRLTSGPGLYQWAGGQPGDPNDRPRPLTGDPRTAIDVPPGTPILVFIHGTASSTLGSFGAFAEPEARAQWRAFRSRFGEHIYAFEHRTLSESPIENAVQLARVLPKGALLSLVSHSRGGMVGELLCLSEITDTQIARFRRRDRELDEADAGDVANLRTLRDLLADRQLQVVRFVRAACPARGTLLAGENLDHFLSVLTNLIGLIPGVGTGPVYHVIKRVTLEVAKNRARPELVPGIEAMIPTSPLVALLNSVERPAHADLAVVAGDIEGGGWLKRLGVFVSDSFIYASRDNDLVVNTDSMFEGVPRESGGHYVFDQGADVNHFSYFRNERTRSTLQHWLLARPGEIPAEYRPIERDGRPPIPMLRGIQKRSGAAQPVVFVVPDMMGSHLSVDGRRVWLDYPQLLAGGLGPIESLSDQRVEPTHLLGDYGALCDYLSNTHEVIPFAYDWRKSIWDAGQQLAEHVRGKLAATSQPICFVAHGAGGLVVRAMIEADQRAVWNQVCARDGSRVVMLGTPNRGSHAMVETLLGMAATVKQLALLDVARGRQGIADIVARFPGALELLPIEDEPLFSPGSWDAFRAANGGCGARPSADALSSALKALRRLPEALPHAGRVLYVAGSAPVTPCGAAIENGRAVLKATSQGDGRVTHASGRLPGVATWYVEAEHGELADSPGVFPAILELLQTGTTARLATAPSAERAIPSGFTYVPEPVLYPTETDLAAGAMGRRRKPRVAKSGGTMRVRVVHGDLRYAKYPIMVGHYEGDTIAGAESQLDQRLDHALSDRYQLGLYPGELGTVAVLQRESTRFAKELGLPKGAIVVGLGKMGELSAGVLADVVRKGTLQYVMHLADAAPPPGEPIAAPDGHRPTVDAGLSVLLIGANTASSMTVNDSVGAIVRGVARANLEIEQTLGSGARVSEIELVELFADAAIQATYAARALAASLSDELGIRIDVASVLERGRGAQNRLIQTQNRDYWRRVVVTRIDSGDSQPVRPPLPEEWARRLLGTVLEESQGDAARVEAALDLLAPSWRRREQPEGTLRFLALSDRARAEVIMQDRQPELIERLVKTSVGDTRFKRETANTLFQLLVPNALKESLAQQSWLVLVVDGDTAAYPWELMVDGQEPLSARIGMVRQLETARFRPQIRASTSRVVYVVGDPVTSEGIAPLPGARAEAKMVAALFRGHDYEVTHSEERPLAEEVLNGLFAQPYRILHLAGHGYYQPPSSDGRRARSGMVLDTGVYLTAVEIGQMRQVPDLVFLNCCHLAQVGPGGPAPSSAVPYNRLAASISRELIEMGVRAVVAAGWAVRDDAANAFAKAFYEAMLGGETFGRALLLARQENARRFPDCNTWGAYQAYGDPDFKLNPKGDGAAHSTDTLPFVAAEELINELARLRQQAAEARRAEAAEATGKPARRPRRDREPDMFTRIRTLFDACPPEWRGRGDVLTALGETYGELGAAGFEQAVDYYTRALAVEDLEGRVPLRVIEQLANLEARHGAKTQPPRRELIERAIDRLRGLLALSPSAERLRLMASAYKRLAQVAATPADARAAVEESAAHYEKASQIHLERSAIDPYSVLNWLACRAVLGQPAPETEAWLSRCEAAATERFARSHAFWDAVIRLDAAVLRHLLEGDLAAAEDDLVARYTDAREEAQATPREFDSVLDQLGFIASMVDRIGKGTGLAASPEALLKPLGRIRARLAGERMPPEDGARAMPARPSAMSPPAPKRKARRPPRARR